MCGEALSGSLPLTCTGVAALVHSRCVCPWTRTRTPPQSLSAADTVTALGTHASRYLCHDASVSTALSVWGRSRTYRGKAYETCLRPSLRTRAGNSTPPVVSGRPSEEQVSDGLEGVNTRPATFLPSLSHQNLL